MFLQILNKLRRLPQNVKFELPAPPRLEARDLEKAFARLFSTDDGKRVLGYLNGITFMRAAGLDATDNMLRHMDGQRALLSTIVRFIERGRA